MKNYLLLALILPVTLFAQNTPPAPYAGSTINYARVWQATAPGVSPTSLTTAPISDVKQTTQYYDALGRLIQVVSKQSSPQGNDGVVAHTYDPSGRETFNYLPFTSTSAQSGDVTNDGKFKPDAFQQQVAFYNTLWQGQPGETNVGGNLNWAYQQDNFEASPLNRILSSYAPGANWVGNQSAGHSTQIQALVNTATDNVQKWNIAAAQGSIPTSSGAYSAGQLYKYLSIDEQGHQTIVFKDLYGQIILKKVQNTATSDNGSGSAHLGWLCTYYVYDDYGHQRFVITPDVVRQIDGSWGISQALADELCFRFEYDLLDRMIIKKTPGTPTANQGEVWMVYDVRNRLVMMQDGNMRPSSQWLCYIYDALDRQVMTGTITDAGTLSQLQAAVTAQTGSNSNGTLTGATPSSVQAILTLAAENMTGDWQATGQITLNPGFNSNSGSNFTAEIVTQSPNTPNNYVVVNNDPLPSGATLTPLTVTYYDNYNWLPSSGAGLSSTLNQRYTQSAAYFNTSYNSSPAYPQPIVQSTQIHGLATGNMVAVIGASSTPLYSLTIYDDHSRAIQMQKTNLSGGTDILTNQYGWSGLLLRSLVQQQHNGSNPQTQLLSTMNSYDAMERLSSVTKTLQSTVNGTTLPSVSETVVTSTYDELSRLKQEVLGSNMETRLYEYNSRGWLLGVNRNYAKTASQTTSYFGFDLGYDKGTIADANNSTIGSYATPAYNGNIAGAVWKTRGDNQIRKYDFNYDAPNRITAADFNQYTSGSFNKTAGLDFSMSGLSYDANGNIATLNRNGWLLGGSQQIDQLAYNYINGYGNGNRLQNVLDNSAYNGSNSTQILGDFHYTGSKTSGNTDYGYDANGNTNSDVNRSIASISYNYMDLPTTMTFTNGKGTITYVYDAVGNKLQKVTTENNGSVTWNGNAYTTNIVTTTSYDGAFEYKTVSYNNVSLASLQYTDNLQFVSNLTGRIRGLYTNPSSPHTITGFAFDYFLKDNLGNVRMVLTDQQESDPYPAATLESSSIATEQQYYNITNDASHIIPVSSLSWWNSASGSSYADNNGITNPGNPNPNATSTQVYRLNGQTGDRYGLGITLKVMAGDQISIFGKSIWHSTGATPGSFPISSVLSSFLSSFAGTSAVVSGGHGVITGSALNGASATTSNLTNFLNNTQNPTNPAVTPKAAINWILFNDQFVPVSMGTDLVNASGDMVKSHSVLNIPMAANGYLYVYCSNESSIDVFFDNLQVLNQRGPILEETHYYPYGLAMAGISDRAWNQLPDYLHFNSNELQTQEFSDGTGLDEYDFNARFYDQQLGRFIQPDPESLSGGQEGMSPYQFGWNNPVLRSDPNGKCPICVVAIIGAVVGAAINVATHWDAITANGFDWGAFGSAALVGAASGAIGAFTGGTSLAAIGVGGLIGGTISGMFASGFSSIVASLGNGIAFGDPFSLSSWGRDVVVGGLTAGVLTGVTAAIYGENFWDGSLPPFNLKTTPVDVHVEPVGETDDISVANNYDGIDPNSGAAPAEDNNLPTPAKDEGYSFDRNNGASHFLKHTRGVNGKLIPTNKPDMDPTMSFKEYTEGARRFLGSSNPDVASVVGKDGRLRMINFATREFGVADPVTKKIISYFVIKPTDDIYKYWATQLLR